MDERWECPAKVNLSLRVGRRDASGYHPLSSLVQTLSWVDDLTVEEADEDVLVVEGAELPEGGDNLVWRALDALGLRRPALRMVLVKRIAVAAGLGGGSSDAAGALAACGRLIGAPAEGIAAAAARTGADVPFFLTGGTAVMEGRGDRISARPALAGFALAVVVPPFELATADVYRSWDELGEPTGPTPAGRSLPPSLRLEDPLVNDLAPAAVALVPALADWMRDLERSWGRPVIMSGSGPSLFGFFADEEEASAAAAEAPAGARAAVGVGLRRRGVAVADR